MNTAQETTQTQAPVVGMAATLTIGSDRYPCTVIAVKGKRITVQRDKARRRDGGGASEHQVYLYLPDPDGKTLEVSLRRDGYWRPTGRARSGYWVSLGERNKHRDPCF